MSFTWTREETPRWDADKEAVFSGYEPAVFGLPPARPGDLLADEWWRVENRDGAVVGYGRLDNTWGDAEILMLVRGQYQGAGVGRFILRKLEDEAASEGLNYLYNTVSERNPDRERVIGWLRHNGFSEGIRGEFRKKVGAGAIGVTG